MEEILLGGVDAAALRAGLDEEQLARGARWADVHALDEARGLEQPAAAQPLEHEEAILTGTAQRIRQRVAVDPLVAPVGNRCQNPTGAQVQEGEQPLVALRRFPPAEGCGAGGNGRGLRGCRLRGRGDTVAERVDTEI